MAGYDRNDDQLSGEVERNMQGSIRPSAVLDMTLTMFELLEIRGINNVRTLYKIISNLEELHKALLRIEEEANKHDNHNQPGENI